MWMSTAMKSFSEAYKDYYHQTSYPHWDPPPHGLENRDNCRSGQRSLHCMDQFSRPQRLRRWLDDYPPEANDDLPTDYHTQARLSGLTSKQLWAKHPFLQASEVGKVMGGGDGTYLGSKAAVTVAAEIKAHKDFEKEHRRKQEAEVEAKTLRAEEHRKEREQQAEKHRMEREEQAKMAEKRNEDAAKAQGWGGRLGETGWCGHSAGNTPER
ncbi:hypothetical protein LTR85_002172 [Meristemomyces frigidus]|nr:hypothetical protein LTR85_002172 [Meristemomyces frigidus]